MNNWVKDQKIPEGPLIQTPAASWLGEYGPYFTSKQGPVTATGTGHGAALEDFFSLADLSKSGEKQASDAPRSIRAAADPADRSQPWEHRARRSQRQSAAPDGNSER